MLTYCETNPSENTPNPLPDNEWDDLVRRIQRNEASGMEQLYALFSRGVRFHLCRQLGPQELDDRLHDVFVIVVQAIRNGDLREPQRLMGFVRTVARRQVATYIHQAVQSRKDFSESEPGVILVDRRSSPEDSILGRERKDLMGVILRSLSPRDREILTRFYLQEQPQEQICADMGLTDTQFRLLKSRAKNRFGELGRRKLERTTGRRY